MLILPWSEIENMISVFIISSYDDSDKLIWRLQSKRSFTLLVLSSKCLTVKFDSSALHQQTFNQSRNIRHHIWCLIIRQLTNTLQTGSAPRNSLLNSLSGKKNICMRHAMVTDLDGEEPEIIKMINAPQNISLNTPNPEPQA